MLGAWKNLLKAKKSHCLFLQVTHSSDVDTSFWKSQWIYRYIWMIGYCSAMAPADSEELLCFSIIFKEKLSHSELIVKLTGWQLWWIQTISFIILSNIYGYKNENQNTIMLEDKTKVISAIGESCLAHPVCYSDCLVLIRFCSLTSELPFPSADLFVSPVFRSNVPSPEKINKWNRNDDSSVGEINKWEFLKSKIS